MTIKDLSEITGYGVATISRVLNGHPNVSEKAKKIILEAVEESGFQLNVNAKQLKQQHSNAIVVVCKGTENRLFGALVEAIQSLIAQTEYPLFVDYVDEEANEVLRGVQLCLEKKPLGMLFLGGNQAYFQKDFHRITIPCVLVSNDASDLNFPNLSSVATDDRAAAYSAVNALLELGHRRVAMIGGDRAVSDTSRLRYEGCMQALQDKNVAFDPQLDYVGTRYSYRGGYQAVRKLLADGRQFTALFAAADVMAIGAIRALRDSGLRVPEDVSVMGFDGLSIGAYLIPQLSTVAQSVQPMAQRSVEILLAGIREKAPACHEAIPYTLCQKESTSRP